MLQVRCAHPTGNFAPKCPFGTFRCSGRLILRKEYTVLFAPKRSTFRFAALTLRVPSHRNIPLECSGVAHCLFYDFAPSSMRTLVFRSAYSTSRNARASAAFAASIKPHRGLISKTLMLQVRRAHPTPSHRNAPSGHSGVAVGLFYAKSTQYSLLQNARPSGSLRSPCGCLRTATSLRNVPVLRMAYFLQTAHCAVCRKTHMLQVRCAHPAGTGELRTPPSSFTAGAGTSEKEMRRKTEGRSEEKLLK